MNSITLLAQVLTEPELRYTPDNQTPVSSFLVEFPAVGRDDTPNRVKVVGWGNLATTIAERKYRRGDRVIVEGRIRIDTIDRNGRKEKATEIVASRIHDLANLDSMTAPVVDEPVVVEDNVPF